MSSKGKTGSAQRKRGLKYPEEFVASELGIDRAALKRACEASEIHVNGAGLTFAQAYAALSARHQDAAARRRKNNAEAEAAELDTAKKRGETIFLPDHKAVIQDIATKLRVEIQGMKFLSSEQQRKVIEKLREIKPSAAGGGGK